MTAPGRRGRAVRLTANPEEVGRGLGQVVVVLLELLRDLLERQAVRRMDSGTLPPERVEDLGRALIEVRAAIAEVRESLGVSAEQARSATERARELVGDWPPPDVGASRTRGGAAGRTGGGATGRTGRGAAGGPSDAGRERDDDPRTGSGIPAAGGLLGTGRRHHERGRPAARARGAAPPGWDLP
ncbi:gas vesicle protein K [Frankia sp. CNm7]|uniref:Gas vesicle protein K n=1 Tax=Frankia nepalensis TaxID=1836974 RepID=A0A937RCS0_9ACTN|nr:gas vesicle protein GvpK [Frankia nepalensis]MBL7496597.1 gas vesicle protein K [Frankia nepalensis]MBL7513340.1 gas vesicle protein K [Frankia nepalensis]MBL7521599.1 gas vesicle protein K [Frankia nepalensis]MBL7626605.1 gas vesicle protein K [Frankia nepalensis]